jgi:uncharacterized protein (TIGR02588 family)
MAPKARSEAPPIRKAPSTSTAEWIVAIVSAALVIGIVGFLFYEGVRSPEAPPDVTVEIDSIQPAGPGYLVLFRAENGGRTTAANVVVVGELAADTGRVEEAETTLDYVPAGGMERGGLYFEHDPRPLRLQLRARGYSDP